MLAGERGLGGTRRRGRRDRAHGGLASSDGIAVVPDGDDERGRDHRDDEGRPYPDARNGTHQAQLT